LKLADRGETDPARVRPESRHGLPGLSLERATAEDLPALAALEAECHTHPWNQSQFQEEASLGPPNALLVLRAAAWSPERWRGIRAYTAYRVVVDEMHILNLAVAPGWRRRGLARWLLGFAVPRAARSGARRVFLEVRQSNRDALSLYEALGFGRVGMRSDYYSDPREAAVLLALEKVPNTFPLSSHLRK